MARHVSQITADYRRPGKLQSGAAPSKVAEAADRIGMQHIASTFIAGLGCALFGWALVVISSRIERERQQRQPDEFGEHMSPLSRSPRWIQFARSWLLP